MAGIVSAKMKRKDLEEVYDEFSEFSLSSPARKIRRLDAELPPIMEEEDPSIPLVFEQPIPNGQNSCSVPGSGSMMAAAVDDITSNEERALVLYKTVNNPLIFSSSSSDVSFKVDSDVLSGLKNQFYWPGYPNPITVEEAFMDDKPATTTNNSLAVVPWRAPIFAQATGDGELRGEPSEELMDAEVAEGGASMEVEEDESYAGTAGVGVEGFQQWPQHCMTPQFPPTNSSTPITWPWGQR